MIATTMPTSTKMTMAICIQIHVGDIEQNPSAAGACDRKPPP